MQMMRLVLPANGLGLLTAIEQCIETMGQSAAELIQQANLTPHQTSQLCTFLMNVSTGASPSWMIKQLLDALCAFRCLIRYPTITSSC